MAKKKKAAAAPAIKKKEAPGALAKKLAAKFDKDSQTAVIEKKPKQKPLNELTRNSAILESLNEFIYKRKNQ